MSKRLPYYQSEPAEYLAGDIMFCSYAAQGVFGIIRALYWQKDCQLTVKQVEKRLKDSEGLIIELISENIIKVDADNISISFLDEQFEKASGKSKANSENGKKGAAKRWANKGIDSEAIATPLKSDSESIALREDKIREDKMKDNNTPDAKASESLISVSKKQSTPQEEERKKVPLKKESFEWEKLLAFINKTTGRKFQVINKAIQSKYKARLRDGYTKDNISNAIINAAKSEFHKDNNCQYLTPEYFSRAETIDKFSEVKDESDKKVAPKMNT